MIPPSVEVDDITSANLFPLTRESFEVGRSLVDDIQSRLSPSCRVIKKMLS